MIRILTLSSFISFSNHPLGLVHLATQWQLNTSINFIEPHYLDTDYDTVHLLSLTVDIPQNMYFRARFIDGLELEGEWADPVLVTIVVAPDYGGGEDDFITFVAVPTQDDCIEDTLTWLGPATCSEDTVIVTPHVLEV